MGGKIPKIIHQIAKGDSRRAKGKKKQAKGKKKRGPLVFSAPYLASLFAARAFFQNPGVER